MSAREGASVPHARSLSHHRIWTIAATRYHAAARRHAALSPTLAAASTAARDQRRRRHPRRRPMRRTALLLLYCQLRRRASPIRLLQQASPVWLLLLPRREQHLRALHLVFFEATRGLPLPGRRGADWWGGAAGSLVQGADVLFAPDAGWAAARREGEGRG